MSAVSSDSFHSLLNDQIANEFFASQQYVALAVWFDRHDLPQLARRFYSQSLQERNHAMMIVKYLLERQVPIQIPSVAAVRNEFGATADLLDVALAQEQLVTGQIETLARFAVERGDYRAMQFMQWFLKTQSQEVSAMSTLAQVVTRADGNLFDVEEFTARELNRTISADPTAPASAGGFIRLERTARK
jgi:ferritin